MSIGLEKKKKKKYLVLPTNEHIVLDCDDGSYFSYLSKEKKKRETDFPSLKIKENYLQTKISNK